MAEYDVNKGWLMEDRNGVRVPYFIHVRQEDIVWVKSGNISGDGYESKNILVSDDGSGNVDTEALSPEVDISIRIKDANGNRYDCYIEHDKIVNVVGMIDLNTIAITPISEITGKFDIVLPIGLKKSKVEEAVDGEVPPQSRVGSQLLLDTSEVSTYFPIPSVTSNSVTFNGDESFVSPVLSFVIQDPIYRFNIDGDNIILDNPYLLYIYFNMVL